MDRKLYKLPIGKSGITHFPCPTCGKGSLKIRHDTFHFEETNESKKAHGHDAWDPDWVELVFSCFLECSNEGCKDVVASTGVGSVSEHYIYDEYGNPEDMDYREDFTPTYFVPHLKIFAIPNGAPADVKEEIEKSFALLFCDPQSAANHVRTALEHLLTQLKVKRYSTSNGKRRFLSLHNRIQLLPSTLQHVQDLFFAVKWLGNAGSHSNSAVTIDDVFDAYELMEELLNEMYANKRKQAKSLAKKINKRKGPK